MPRISVITPVYNGSKYLRIALDSLLAQTINDWELIVIDDGSNDSTPQILDQYLDQRITKIRQENSGEASARNVGLDHAQGEYIAFLDADDGYLPNALADLSGFLNQNSQYDVVFSDGYLCDDHDRKLSRLTEHRPGIYTGNILEPLVLSASVITVPVCTLTRRSAIEDHNIRFDKNLTIGPDWDFWIQLATCVQFGYLDKTTCIYRVHDTNITRTSGLHRRLKDLIYGRIKVMNTEWFQFLSETTRSMFFFNLLIHLLGGQSDQQLAILESSQLRQLSPNRQAHLWRQVGVDRWLRNSERSEVARFLTTASSLDPNDKKSGVLLKLNQFNRPIASCFIRLWQNLNKKTFDLQYIGKHKPKPVPGALGPVGN